MRKHRRTYSTEEKAAALVVLDFHRGNVKRAAQASGVPRKTLSQWGAGQGGVSAEVVVLHRQRALSLADLMEEAVYKIVEGMAEPGRIGEASLLELAKAFGILVDKMQLLRGAPSVLALCPECRRQHPRSLSRHAAREPWAVAAIGWSSVGF